ncbi:DUF814-domain-containing protein [Neoconidiobolus thromboides FSU 785]|nr:DUF814-domain-containing protein [Neoconidiobolus thromboides FSU 785]
MVYYFTSDVTTPNGNIFMGKDKHENEDLIKHGIEEDVWFHVDKLSSAHIYLRLDGSYNWENIPESLLEDLGQLTKANSIEGNKKDNITIIYTPWSNLKKSGDMAVGQVSFHNPKIVKRVYVEKRKNHIINRLNKTKREEYPDLYQEKMNYINKKNKKDKINFERMEQVKIKREEYAKNQKELKSYKSIFEDDTTEYRTNEDSNQDIDDDFM